MLLIIYSEYWWGVVQKCLSPLDWLLVVQVHCLIFI